MEDKGYEVMLGNGHVLIHQEDPSLDTLVTIEVSEVNLYKLKGKPVQALVHEYIVVTTYVIRHTGGWDTCATQCCQS